MCDIWQSRGNLSCSIYFGFLAMKKILRSINIISLIIIRQHTGIGTLEYFSIM